MQTHKAQKIDHSIEYPCPCRRRGQLIPIALTEAFGCNRCQQIFVVEDSGYMIEQLSTTYPYKRAWRWTGHQWLTANSGLRESYMPLSLGIVTVLLVVCLPIALNSSSDYRSLILWALVAVLVTTLPALILWLAYRR
ncbi:MAG: hypothetical protein NZ772_00300 [Cyanobacteria bacterium]|nr:hypothetical protein [Cyanobacteriota bacterium]MDW8199771.1 hypothetical protein [Cyanobacteriota bacterium SKYGB_h_bin112]